MINTAPSQALNFVSTQVDCPNHHFSGFWGLEFFTQQAM